MLARKEGLPMNQTSAQKIRTATPHGEHEKRMGGQRDENWPVWYAAYMAVEQAGSELPT